jgi:hypothetical protein
MTLKYQKRREAIKKLKDPMVQLGRRWNKASKLAKAGIIGAAILPKALLIGAGYAGAKSAAKKDKQPKKYMTG